MRKNSLGILFRMLGLIGKRKRYSNYFYIFLNMICAGLLPVVSIYLPRVVIDEYQSGSSQNVIINYILIFCAIAGIFGVVIAFCKNLGQAGFMAMRIDEFKRIMVHYHSLDYKYLEDPVFQDHFDVSCRAVQSDGTGFQAMLAGTMLIFPEIVTIIALIIIASMFNYILVIACLVSCIASIIINRFISKYVEKNKEIRARRERQKYYFCNISYDFSYGKEIRINNLQEKLAGNHRSKSISYISVIKNIANRRFSLGLIEILFLLLSDGICYYLIINSFFDGVIGLGEVSMYVGLVVALSTALRELSNNVGEMITNASYTKSYFEYMDDKSLFSESGNHKAIPNDETLEIEFKDVCFKYPNTERYVLNHFNFKINAHEKLAIVGTNGAGKSTIIKLITGLYQPTSGNIYINGIDILDFDTIELRKMFSVVYQDVSIYACSVIENVVGTDIENREKGIDALKRVGLEEKISKLKKGYDTEMLKVIDPDGVELSGGQNQKIAIARALFKNGNMVILDEPTSALDALAEAKIYKSFDDLVQDKTAIYISHRLSSTKFCDHIALFTSEGLKEYGTHDELMELKGEYYNMFTIQGKYYVEGVSEDEE